MKRVLLLSRATLHSNPGGDTVQIQQLARHLPTYGWRADITTADATVDMRPYDLLHLFNIFRPADLLIHTQRAHIPYVVSPIYVDYSNYDQHHRKGLTRWGARLLGPHRMEYLKAAARWLRNGEAIQSPDFWWLGQRSSVQRIAQNARLFLPQSHSEQQRFSRDYGVQTPYRVTYCGVNPESIEIAAAHPNFAYRDAVVCIGRIEGLKNQLSLIRAMRTLGLPLFIVGQPSANHQAYAAACRAEGAGWVQFTGQIPHDEVLRILAAARVHVLPSHFETCGLSSLEAAALGTRIVVGDRGDVRDYYGPNAVYCDPDSEASIREAVLTAYYTPAPAGFAKQVLTRFTWQRMAEHTAEGYEAVLKGDVESTARPE